MKRNKLILGTVCSCFILAGIGINIKNALDDYGIGEIKLHPCVAAQGDNTNGDNTNGDNTNGNANDSKADILKNNKLEIYSKTEKKESGSKGYVVILGKEISVGKNKTFEVTYLGMLCQDKVDSQCDQKKQFLRISNFDGKGGMESWQY